MLNVCLTHLVSIWSSKYSSLEGPAFLEVEAGGFWYSMQKVGLQEVIEWLAKPENYQQTDNLPPFIENLDVGAYVTAALPIAGFVLGVNVLDEVVQRGVAAQRKVSAPPSSLTSMTHHTYGAHDVPLLTIPSSI